MGDACLTPSHRPAVEETSNAMALDGIMFEGVSVRVRRPNDYNPAAAASLGPSTPNPNLNLAAIGLSNSNVGGGGGGGGGKVRADGSRACPECPPLWGSLHVAWPGRGQEWDKELLRHRV